MGSDGDYVTSAPTGEEDPGPEDDGCASCSQNQAHHLTQTHTHNHSLSDSCVHGHKNVKNTAWHTHTHTQTLQSSLCLDNLTENHQGNCTLITLCASLALHVSLFVFFLSVKESHKQRITGKDL